MDDAVIREASVDDAPALREYAAELFAERLPGIYRRPVPTLDEERAFVRAYVEPPNSTLLIAEARGRVVGVLGLMGRTLPQETHVGALGISVRRGCRGQGLGTRLIERLFQWAPGHGVRRIEAEAFANNPAAARLYERLGFEREGLRRSAVAVDGADVDVVLFGKVLSNKRIEQNAQR